MEVHCCRCNGDKAQCRWCSCATAGRFCVSCRASFCTNFSPQARSASQPPGSSSAPPSATVGDSTSSSTSHGSEVPSVQSIKSTRVYTFSHVPKGARDAWAGILTQVLREVCTSPQNDLAWRRLLMLQKCILLSPSTHPHQCWKVSLQMIKARISLGVGVTKQSSGTKSLKSLITVHQPHNLMLPSRPLKFVVPVVLLSWVGSVKLFRHFLLRALRPLTRPR